MADKIDVARTSQCFDGARRRFVAAGGAWLGGAALQALAADAAPRGATPASAASISGAGLRGPHFTPKAKRVIYLFQSGGPSHLETFDHKPVLNRRHGEEMPASVRGAQRLTGMSGNQASLPLAGSAFKFARHGQAGHLISELLPETAKVADELCIVKSMFTEAINHDPAITFFQTGSQIAGRPSFGSWIDYGLGSMNDDLPSFVVLVTKGKKDQPLYSRLWGNGFLSSRHQGVKFQPGADAVPYLADPPGESRDRRRTLLDSLARLNRDEAADRDDPDVLARIAQYELAFKMQASVPEIADLRREPKHVVDLYGADALTPGTFAAHCLMARRLAERGVRFIQLYHQGWDQHGGLPGGIRTQCRETDRATYGLITDLKRRGMLDDTLVIWGGEFGRTCYTQGKLTPGNYGRDHHPRCFTAWLAGGGSRAGMAYGATDDFGYNIAGADGAALSPSRAAWAPGAVHVHDLQATVLHLLGLDHERLTYQFQGRRHRLTDVHGHVVSELVA